MPSYPWATPTDPGPHFPSPLGGDQPKPVQGAVPAVGPPLQGGEGEREARVPRAMPSATMASALQARRPLKAWRNVRWRVSATMAVALQACRGLVTSRSQGGHDAAATLRAGAERSAFSSADKRGERDRSRCREASVKCWGYDDDGLEVSGRKGGEPALRGDGANADTAFIPCAGRVGGAGAGVGAVHTRRRLRPRAGVPGRGWPDPD